MDAESLDTTTVTLEADGESHELDVPRGVFEVLAEDEPAVEVMTDLALFELTRNVHAAANHSDEEFDGNFEAVESAVLDRFEERFGITFGEATGHQH